MDQSQRLEYEALRIRMVEERIIELYPSDLIQSPIHLSIGQEAVAVGVCANLNPTDLVFITYRGHAFYIAKGGKLPELFAELMGRRDGISQGKAGSMHLASPIYGVIGASAVVASTISHAVGAALASKIKCETDKIFVANFGDGAMEQGAFYESMNFAALHKLPVLFLCEDNGLAVHSKKSERQSFDLATLVQAFNIPFYDLNEGFDPMKVFTVSKSAVGTVRSTQSPAFLRIKTMRYMEHVGPGEDLDIGFRPSGEIDRWKAKDPISNKTLISKHRDQIILEIDAAVKFALDSPLPTIEDLLTDVY